MELTRVYLEALEGEHFDFFDESIRNKIKDIVFEFLSLVTEKDND
ncbi:MAG: hypothetical protein P1U46_04360 [Patescibacteria group bacterium]|nr:hypothetical protein [Patescibacteria group bacterium]